MHHRHGLEFCKGSAERTAVEKVAPHEGAKLYGFGPAGHEAAEVTGT